MSMTSFNKIISIIVLIALGLNIFTYLELKDTRNDVNLTIASLIQGGVIEVDENGQVGVHRVIRAADLPQNAQNGTNTP